MGRDGWAGAAETAAPASPRVAWLAWSLCALAIALVAAGRVLLVLSGSTAARGYGDQPLQDLAFVGFGLVGALIVSRQPRNVLGWWLIGGLALLQGLGLNGLGYGYVHYALFGAGRGLPAGRWVAWLVEWPNAVSLGLAPLLLLLFPTGRLPSPRWRLFLWTDLALAAARGVASAVRPGPLENFPAVDNPLGLAGAGGAVAGVVYQVASVVIPLFVLAAAGSVLVRLRRARGVERQQVKVVAYGASLMAVVLVSQTVLATLDPAIIDDPTAVSIANLVWALAVLGVPTSMGVAILRYRLWDVDLLINRTLVYGALTVAVVAVYVLVVAYAGAVFQARSGATSLLAAGVAAVLFQPLRERLQRGVNRLLYGQRDEPYAALARLGRRLEETLAPEAVLPTIAETVAQALRLPYAAVALAEEDGSVVAAADGAPAGEVLRLPLVHQHDTLGELLLVPRRPGESFSPADRRLLDALARQAGAAVHAVRLTDDLRRARERLVLAREEERRRLRRDLHDGLGPALASLTLQAEAARDALVAEPSRADALLGDLVEQLQAATAETRRLVYELRPPALDDLGLAGALRAHAASFDHGGGPRVTIEAPERLAPLPAAVEVAAYRIAMEAVTNAARHAGARTCAVRLGLRDADGRPSALELEVIDDGRGLAADRPAGVGLASMRERAAELAGQCRIESSPSGGTRVAVSLPLAGASGD